MLRDISRIILCCCIIVRSNVFRSSSSPVLLSPAISGPSTEGCVQVVFLLFLARSLANTHSNLSTTTALTPDTDIWRSRSSAAPISGTVMLSTYSRVREQCHRCRHCGSLSVPVIGKSKPNTQTFSLEENLTPLIDEEVAFPFFRIFVFIHQVFFIR